ncbi:MAG: outer membrane lipoprotein-sorting protein [Candidatus Margulisbacteria bacterium]|nr:outer membrane lipoprotein-sorting protein [Candidatus Margulisiibacteriota bacterium]
MATYPLKNLTIFFLFITVFSIALEPADSIIKKMDDQMRGKSSYMQITITVKNPRWERNIKLDAWSEGTDRSFIRIDYPFKDKGITFLKLKNDMWQYIPKIEKTIKFPPSMMLQSWMGTDFSNDDLVKESSMTTDYNHRLLEENDKYYKIESIPKKEAAVTWGKIIQTIDKQTVIPLQADFYDEDGNLIRVFKYRDIVRLSDRYFPLTMTLESKSEDKKDNLTTMKFDKIDFATPIPEGIFTFKALKQMSR